MQFEAISFLFTLKLPIQFLWLMDTIISRNYSFFFFVAITIENIKRNQKADMQNVFFLPATLTS